MFAETPRAAPPRGDPRPLPHPPGRRAAGPSVEIATTNLLDDPAMGGILLTATPAEPGRSPAGVVRGRRPADGRRRRGPRRRRAHPLRRRRASSSSSGSPPTTSSASACATSSSPTTAAEPAALARRRAGPTRARRPRPAAPLTTVDGVDTRSSRCEATNLLDDPLVQGVVLVVRDVTERRRGSRPTPASPPACSRRRRSPSSPPTPTASSPPGTRPPSSSLGWPADRGDRPDLPPSSAATPPTRSSTIYDDLPAAPAGRHGRARGRTLVRRDGTTFPAYIVAVGPPRRRRRLRRLPRPRPRPQRPGRRPPGAGPHRGSLVGARPPRPASSSPSSTRTRHPTYAGPGLRQHPRLRTRVARRHVAPRPPAPRRPRRARAGSTTSSPAGPRATSATTASATPTAAGGSSRPRSPTSGPSATSTASSSSDATSPSESPWRRPTSTSPPPSTRPAPRCIVVGLDRRVVAWNRGAEQLLGWPAEEAIGSTPPDRAVDAAATTPIDAVEAAARPGTSTPPPCGATAPRVLPVGQRLAGARRRPARSSPRRGSPST